MTNIFALVLEQLVNEWAEKVWDAYAVYHNLAREWIKTVKQKSVTKPLR